MNCQMKSIKGNEFVEAILASFFEMTKIVCDNIPETILLDNSNIESGMANAMFALWAEKYPSVTFLNKVNNLMDASNKEVMSTVINETTSKCPVLSSYLRYLLGEMECNIQQHAQAKHSWLYVDYNSSSQSVDVVIADDGLSIMGSYINSEMHVDKLSEGDASAIDLARSGYSTKNRPSAENRGFGISTNVKIVADVLDGVFSIISGRALFLKSKKKLKLYDLPDDIEWKGTIIAVRIPVPTGDFNMYKYIE